MRIHDPPVEVSSQYALTRALIISVNNQITFVTSGYCSFIDTVTIIFVTFLVTSSIPKESFLAICLDNIDRCIMSTNPLLLKVKLALNISSF